MKRMDRTRGRAVAHQLARATAAILLGVLIPHSSSAQQRDPLAGFDVYVLKGMQDWKIPGLAVAIVKNDSVIYAKGFGVRTLGKPEKVDENTLFAIASDTKSFTGIVLAILADEGKVRWDAPVTTYLPWFQLSNDYLTRELTVRDLLTHRTGLARGDLLWTGGMGYSRQELLRRVRFLKPSWSMRSRYGYSNLMYVAAGEVAAAVEHKPWDEIVRARIFTPLGMTSTNTSVSLLPRLPNVASPHANVDSVVRVVDYTDADNIASAGAINSSVADMAKWIRFQLDSGRVGGKPLVSKRNFVETHSAQIAMRLDSTYRAFNPFTHVRSYAFGWNVLDYRGREMLSHAGNLSGMAAIVGLLPEERLGIVVLSNLEGNALRESLMYKAFDLFLGAPERDWSRVSLVERATFDSIEAKDLRDKTAKRVPGTKPSLPLARYVGAYTDSLYGRAEVRMEKGHLVLALAPKQIGDLEHWHFDTFKVTWRDHRDGWNLVTFALDTDGGIDTLRADIGGLPEEWPVMKRLPDATTASAGNRQ
jgi:CubicO group peptidase (beta-lactamase class C family)